MACTFLGSTLYPSGVTFPPKKLRSLDLKINFLQKVMLFALAVPCKVMMPLSWETSAFPSANTLSTVMWTYQMPLSTLLRLSWKTFPTTLSPNGSHTHQNLPHRVVHVAIRLLALSNITCQYPDLVSSRVKSVEPVRSGRISSIVLL